MTEILMGQISDKALSLMGERKIQTFNFPGNPSGTVIGFDGITRNLIVDLDGRGEKEFPLTGYLENYRFDHPGINVLLTQAFRDMPYPEQHSGYKVLKDKDIIGDDQYFTIAQKIAPKYLAREIIKSAETVTAIHRSNSGGQAMDVLISATTARGTFTLHVKPQFLEVENPNESLDSLPVSPGSAISLAIQSIPELIREFNPLFGTFNSQSDDDSGDFYVVASKNPDSSGISLKFLDYRGMWTDERRFAAETPLSNCHMTKEWASFLDGYLPKNYIMMPISRCTHPKDINDHQEENSQGLR